MVDTQAVALFKNECHMAQKHQQRWALERKKKFEDDLEKRGRPLPTVHALQGAGLLSLGLSIGSNAMSTLPQGFVTPRSKTSASRRFLDEKLGLTTTPYDAKDEASDVDLLCFGVSQEGLGRSGYLNSRKKLAPQEKFAKAMTSSHAYGWSVPEASSSGPSYARRPIVQNTFYRNNGVLNSSDLNIPLK